MKRYSGMRSEREHGGASIFVVVFSALLVTIITVGFVQLMLRSQKDAMTLDLSQSAYDSAMAGVEDAKRAIVAAQGDSSLMGVLGSKSCGSVKQILYTTDDPTVETLIQQDEIDRSLSQAYTCVTVSLTPKTASGSAGKDTSNVLPLTTVGNESFDTLHFSWRLPQAVGEASYDSVSELLPPSEDWPSARPALIRLQLIQYERDALRSGVFDSDDAEEKGISRTIFLMPNGPKETLATPPISFDGRDAGIALADCNSTGECAAQLSLPSGGVSTARYLRITALYNDANYSYSVSHTSDAGKKLPFEGVVAEVDSTGRAGDVYRRVKAQVQLFESGVYPEAALDILNDICKTMHVGSKIGHYRNNCHSD